MFYFLYLFLFVFLYRLLFYGFYWWKAKKLSDGYDKWVQKADHKFIENTKAIQDVLSVAKVRDAYLDTLEPAGFGKLRSQRINIKSNLFMRREDVVTTVMTLFLETIGSLKHEFFNTLNILWWIKTILFLPKSLLLYLGLDENKLLFRICNILLTILWWVFGALASYASITHTTLQQILQLP